MISVGAREPAAARSAMTLAGMSCTEALLMAQKSACASEAVPGRGFTVSSACIAFTPNGVAGVPRPSTFAERFMSIAPIAGCSGGPRGRAGT